ncbi:MAG: hypothetical protein ACRDID_17945, partial [Ktedonobacterales bacterium]
WVTIARNLDEATAVLRSALHPLIVHVGAPIHIEDGWDGSPLLELLGNPEFAATHAFIVVWGGGEEPGAGIREKVEQCGAGYVRWLRLPTVRTNIESAQMEAARYLASRQ